MTKDKKIRLLTSKSQAYKSSYIKAVEDGDTEAAANWKKGYQEIKEEIYELKCH
jgi:hypothetical protein